MSQLKVNLQEILAEKQQKIIAENIRRNVSVFGVVGTLDEGIDTSDANAVASELIKNKTAYVNGQKVTGEMPHVQNDGIGNPAIHKDIGSAEEVVDFYDNGTYFGIKFDNLFEDFDPRQIPVDTTIVGVDKDVRTQLMIRSSVLAGGMNLSADKIKQGETILGIAGTVVPEDPEHADYDDCLELTNQILGNV